MEETKHPVIVIINQHKFDVSNYIKNHPGEGINGIYLEDFDWKDASKEFEYYHGFKLEQLYHILELVIKYGEYSNIKYIGPVMD